MALIFIDFNFFSIQFSIFNQSHPLDKSKCSSDLSVNPKIYDRELSFLRCILDFSLLEMASNRFIKFTLNKILIYISAEGHNFEFGSQGKRAVFVFKFSRLKTQTVIGMNRGNAHRIIWMSTFQSRQLNINVIEE